MEKIILFPLHYSCLYFLLAFIVSVYYGFRSWCIQKNALHNSRIQNKNCWLKQRAEYKDQDKASEIKEKKEFEEGCEEFFVWIIIDFIFNAVGGMTGFIAGYLLARIYRGLSTIPKESILQMQWGFAVLIIFLVITFVSGVSGFIPQNIVSGKFFKS
ncbi:MAG: hypothetical protein KGI84_03155 [Elusimicrobia bacterium]|nr:hypothetical protein [Elusimicrobiota bacterium]